MNQIQEQNSMLCEQKIQQVLVFARTFRRHPLILSGREQVSPYDLACNGFVNKNFKEQQKQEIVDDSQVRQVTCICRIPECSKTIKFNDKIDTDADEEQIQSILTEHEEGCLFYGKQFSKLQINQLFQVSDILFDKIVQSYKKDEKKLIESVKISWSFIEKLFLSQQETKGSFNMLLECYKNLDHRFSINSKKFDKKKLFSLFGWKLNSIKQNQSIVIKCHYCGKRLQKQFDNKEIDLQNQHNSWCLIKDKSYQIWRLILKKKFMSQGQKNIEKQVDTKIKEMIVPKRKSQIKQKQIREQLFQIARPALQKIDQLLLNSIQTVKKQRHLNETLKNVHQNPSDQKENVEIKDQEHLKVFQTLDQISINAKQIVRNFINSIQTKPI